MSVNSGNNSIRFTASAVALVLFWMSGIATLRHTDLGQRADEAVGNVDQYLDDAQLAGLKRVRIVHGKGSGALRRAIHERLRTNSLVSTFTEADPAEGGTGATIVELI